MGRTVLLACLVILVLAMFCGCTGILRNNTPATLTANSAPGLAPAENFVGIPTPVVDGKKIIQVYAHRGARSYVPENVLPGYRTGLAIGTDWVDMDVVMDRDSNVVVSHDLWLNPDIVRGPDGKFLARSRAAMLRGIPPGKTDEYLQPYLVRNLNYSRLQQYDVGMLNPDSPYAAYFPDQYPVNGTRMPLLRDVIRYTRNLTGGRVGYQIEIKSDPEHDTWTYPPAEFASALYTVLKEENITDTCEIQAFDWRYLYELQNLDPGIATAYLTEWDNEPETPYSFFCNDTSLAGLWTGGKLVKDYNNSIPQMVRALGGKCWEPEDVTLTKEALDEAHRLGLKVVVWTWPEHSGSAFDPVTVQMMIDMGVDGIITDDPGRLISMLAARNYRVPERFIGA